MTVNAIVQGALRWRELTLTRRSLQFRQRRRDFVCARRFRGVLTLSLAISSSLGSVASSIFVYSPNSKQTW